jgi:hypothetical protein
MMIRKVDKALKSTPSGIKDRDDKSSTIEILMTEFFVKISPTDTLRLVKQVRHVKESKLISGLKWYL